MQKAVEAYLDAADEKRAAVKRADAGHVISGEAVHAWIASWGTDEELPMPTVEKPKRRVRPGASDGRGNQPPSS